MTIYLSLGVILGKINKRVEAYSQFSGLSRVGSDSPVFFSNG